MTTKQTSTPGRVVFVGTGPGDPGLLTVRAVEELGTAQVVVLDRPPQDERRSALIERYCPADIELVEAGFGEDGQPLTHAGRAKLITKAAKSGSRVVRLLDGDGSLFCGLAEEMLACEKAGVPFDVVPGVAAATAVPAFAGVPVTSTSVQQVHFIDARTRFRPADVADAKTSVVLLGTRLDLIGAAAAIVKAGRAGSSEVVVTSGGTTTTQSSNQTTLDELAAGSTEPLPGDDAFLVAVLGPTVSLRERISWFETKPLFGWRVLVPRTQQQAGPLCDRLARYGGVADLVPTISVEPPRTPHQMDKAVTGLVTGRYEWVGFTSVNAVRAVREKIEEYGLDARAFSGLKVAAVGGVTAAALRDWGIKPDLVPSGEQSAKGLLADWPPYDRVLDPINRVFLPRADIATDTLVAGLQESGWEVDDITAYRTVRAAPPPAPVREAIKAGRFDAVVFTSSSTVRNLVGIAGKPHPSTVVACIGPATAKTAEEHGLKVDVLAPNPSANDLVDALADYGSGLRRAAISDGLPVLRPSQRGHSNRRRAR
ncbi:MAG: uroporphyrinogen-III synthase [Actinomycetales bacterium]